MFREYEMEIIQLEIMVNPGPFDSYIFEEFKEVESKWRGMGGMSHFFRASPAAGPSFSCNKWVSLWRSWREDQQYL